MISRKMDEIEVEKLLHTLTFIAIAIFLCTCVHIT